MSHKNNLLAGIALLLILLLAGCADYYPSINKDEVLVRPISKPSAGPDSAYEGLLSGETVRDLAVNAVGKFLDMHPALQDLSFEVLSMDKPSVGQALDNLIQGDLSRKYVFGALAKDRRNVSPLYLVTISVRSSQQFMVVLHAETGEVLGIARKYDYVKSPVSPTDSRDIPQLADDYMERLGYDLSKYFNKPLIYSKGALSEIYYFNKDSEEIDFCVFIDGGTRQAFGFVKDMTTMVFLAPYASG